MIASLEIALKSAHFRSNTDIGLAFVEARLDIKVYGQVHDTGISRAFPYRRDGSDAGSRDLPAFCSGSLQNFGKNLSPLSKT